MEALLVVGKTICLPFTNEEHYEQCMKDARTFRNFVTGMYGRHPELFPQQRAQGFILHGFTPPSRKQKGFQMRAKVPEKRIRVSGTSTVSACPGCTSNDHLDRTALVVIRMPGGVGGEGPRGLSIPIGLKSSTGESYA